MRNLKKEENESEDFSHNYQDGFLEMKKQKEKFLEERMTQEYKKLKTMLLKSHSDQRAILFVSSLPGEGTTTVITQLAKEMLSEGDRKIILVDANLRNPELHKRLGIKKADGLIDILKDITFNQALKSFQNSESENLMKAIDGSDKDKEEELLKSKNREVAAFVKRLLENFEKNVEGFIKKTDYKNLMAISSGVIGEKDTLFPENGNITRLIRYLKRRFDHVFLDGAPGNLYTDSMLLAPHVDGVILVVEAEKTSREIVLKVKGEFESINSTVIGAVLNKQKYYIPESIYKLI